jgi:hypothetical protein
LIRTAGGKPAQNAGAGLHCSPEQGPTIGGDVATVASGTDCSGAQGLEGQTGFATLWQRKGGLLRQHNVFLSHPLCHSRPPFPRLLVRNSG